MDFDLKCGGVVKIITIQFLLFFLKFESIFIKKVQNISLSAFPDAAVEYYLELYFQPPVKKIALIVTIREGIY